MRSSVIFFVLSRLALPRISAVLSERQGTITNDLAAAENLKSEAVQAEEAYKKALEDARLEASKIIESAKAEIKQELDVAIEKADADISVKASASEEAIDEIRKDALANVKSVAKDITSELVKVLGGKVDTKTLTSVVNAKMKG